MLAKCFFVKRINGCVTVYLLTHHGIWDLESEYIFKDRIYYFLNQGNQSAPLICDDTNHPWPPSKKLKDYLQRFISVFRQYQPNQQIISNSNCRINYIIKNYQVATETNPVITVLNVMYNIVKHYGLNVTEFPILLLYHSRNKSNDNILGMFLELLPVILHLHQEKEVAVNNLIVDKNFLIDESYSSQCIDGIVSFPELAEINMKTPEINIRIHNCSHELDLIENDSSGEGYKLFSIDADVYDNGIIIQCTIERERANDVRKMLDNMLLREKVHERADESWPKI